MTMTHRIRCDACQNERVFGTPHVAVGLRPGFPGSVRDLHFCGTECLRKHLGNLTSMLDEHAAGYRSRAKVTP